MQVLLDWFNPMPDDNILDWSLLKQIADDISSAFKMKKKKSDI